MPLPNYSEDVLALNPHLRESLTAKTVARKTAPAAKRGEYKNDIERCAEDWVKARADLWWYEKMTLHIEGGKYTPDFIFVDRETRETWYVEVKSSTHSKGYRESKQKIRAAAERFPHVHFVLLLPKRVTKNRQGVTVHEWSVMEI